MNLKHFFFTYSKPEIINPYLAAYTPFVFIYAYNIDQAHIFNPVRLVILVFIFITLFNLILQKILAHKGKSSLINCAILFISFVTGHLTAVLPYFEIGRFNTVIVSRNPLLLLGACVFIWLSCIAIVKTKKVNFLKLLNRVIASTLLLVILLNLVKIALYTINRSGQKKGAPLSSMVLSATNLNRLPDIYYIILDGRARADVLTQLYEYPESELMNYFEQAGFFVGHQSKSNYLYTQLSLATSLNYDYIENLTPDFIYGNKNPTLLATFIENNKAARRLKSLGYTYVLISSGYYATEKSPLADTVYEYVYDFNNLELAYLRTNIFARLLTYVKLDPRTFHHNRILYQFKTLKNIPNDQRPTFTFAHILVPHPPFVFNEKGDEVGKDGRFRLSDGYGSVSTKEEYKSGYLKQLIYTDTLLIETLKEILSKSDTPPMIIIQSDHGPASEIKWQNHQSSIFLSDVIDVTNPNSVFERTGILNAYYFPYQGSAKLYDSITPVNSFRILFNYYFGGDFPILSDQTFLDR